MPLHPSSPEQFLGFMLGSTYRSVSNQFARVLKPYDITPEQWSVLFIIAGREGVNQKEISEASAKDQPTTARIVELLQKKGFITKSVSNSDRRAFQLYATAEGKDLIDLTLPLEQKNIEKAVSGFTTQQLTEFRQMLELIQRNMGNHQE
ncbi:MarR family winged helix-turn-helix transcriptional regulator [Paenibacillus sp. sgz500958]|uniref:MarR family winged helix-turn-helix transcriptional regulator n=1 Tax=Paenibacillus sp. sgz500958 TaxID=3242475 RepID=UPI0036D36E38